LFYDSTNPNHATTHSITFLKYYKYFIAAMGFVLLFLGFWFVENYDWIIFKIQQFQQHFK